MKVICSEDYRSMLLISRTLKTRIVSKLALRATPSYYTYSKTVSKFLCFYLGDAVKQGLMLA